MLMNLGGYGRTVNKAIELLEEAEERAEATEPVHPAMTAQQTVQAEFQVAAE
jgi:hypothetical protein